MRLEPLLIENVSGDAAERCILRVSGPILISNFFEFQSLTRASTSQTLILDLTNVPYVDSAGVGVLVGAYVNHQKDGRTLALVGVSDRVRGTLQVTRVDQFFLFYPTLDSTQQ